MHLDGDIVVAAITLITMVGMVAQRRGSETGTLVPMIERVLVG